MKIILIAALLPLSAYAELSVVCRPLSLIVEQNKTNSVYLYVRNDGNESVVLPIVDSEDPNKIGDPITGYTLRVEGYRFDSSTINKFFGAQLIKHHAPLPSYGLLEVIEEDGSTNLICQTGYPITKSELMAGETRIYRFDWIADERFTNSRGQRPEMYIVKILLDDCSFEIKPITYLTKEDTSNQGMEPTRDNAQSIVPNG